MAVFWDVPGGTRLSGAQDPCIPGGGSGRGGFEGKLLGSMGWASCGAVVSGGGLKTEGSPCFPGHGPPMGMDQDSPGGGGAEQAWRENSRWLLSSSALVGGGGAVSLMTAVPSRLPAAGRLACCGSSG